jgi:uncharacterized repeat protein (TIGR03803 family)
MLSTKRIRSHRLTGSLAGVFLAGLALVGACRGQAVTNLGGFSVTDGAFPLGLAQGTDGNFYGTTATGGGAGLGTIFRMTPQGLVSIIYRFSSQNLYADGANPTCGMILASDGNFYGTTSRGSLSQGTVFRIGMGTGPGFLHLFGTASGPAHDGTVPMGSLVQNLDGKLYGTTSAGGTAGKGTVFQLGLDGTYQILHNFGDGSVAGDAISPAVGLVRDAQGNLYGTSFHGGSYNQGAVYKIDTQFRLSILYSFNQSTAITFGTTALSSGGCYPNSKLLLGADGNLYGTTAAVPGYGFGTIYRITPTGTETVLHYFGDGSVTNDGQQTASPVEQGENALVQSPTNGSIYGTTSAGGLNGKGVLFAMTPAGQVTILHSFGDSSVTNDGTVPLSGVIFGTDGNLYGTTGEGGTTGWTVYGAGAQTAAVSASSSSSTSVSQTSATTNDTVVSDSDATLTITAQTGPGTNGTFILVTVAGTSTSSASTGTTYSPGGAIAVNPGTLTVSGTAYVGTLFKVQPTLPAFASNMVLNGAVGVPVTYQVTANQPVALFNPLYTMAPGLTMNDLTGIVSGTPTQAGVFNVPIAALLNSGPDVMGNLTVVIRAQPVITSILTGYASTSTPYFYQVAAAGVPNTYGASGLPAGLSIDPTTGYITGTPTVTGTFAVDISAGNIAGTGHALLNLSVSASAPSPTYVQIHNFQDGTVTGEGQYPTALVAGPQGTLVGATAGTGTIFNLSPTGRGALVDTVTRQIGAPPGYIMLGLDGNYYGTTQTGGTANLGTFFQVTPAGYATVLHNFGDGSIFHDGENPIGAICEINDGIFLGITQRGGSGFGTVYTFSTRQNYEQVYSDFSSSLGTPISGLVQTSPTDFYGVTLNGGSAGEGSVYHIAGALSVPPTVLYSFGTATNDGQMPRSELIFHDGALYGTTTIGGTLGRGTLFKLTTAGVESVLHNFGDGSVAGDGINPIGSIVAVDRTTTGVTIFGTTQSGGANGDGAIFELDEDNTLTLLHSFNDPNTPDDGMTPLSGLCLGVDGNLYGTTVAGGLGSGTFFGVVTNLLAPPASTVTPLWTLTGNLPLGLTFDNTTGTISGSPVNGVPGGLYHVSITSPTNVTTSATYALAQSFSQWSMAKTGTNLVTTATSTDGVPNMLKYLFDIGPNGPMTMADHAAMPAIGIDDTTVPGTPYLSLRYRQNAAMSGVDVGLETSDDMVTWTPVDSNQIISKQVDTDSTTGDPVMEMGAPRDDSPQQFLRLKVTSP